MAAIVAGALVAAGITAGVLAAGDTSSITLPQPSPSTPTGAPSVGSSSPSLPARTDAPEDDPVSAAARALATRPMMALPAQAAQPHALSTNPTPPLLLIPRPLTGFPMPGGFPQTGAGALSQLAVLDRIGLEGGDPDRYQALFARLSAPGAPRPETTALATLLVQFREHAGASATGPLPDTRFSWQPTHGLIKGVVDDGRTAVVCVLGQLTVRKDGQLATAGLGDCQAMAWRSGAWRIAPGPPAATAPSAWPGSTAAQNAGYRELRTS